MNLINKKIISTTLNDTRFLVGETLEDSLESDYAFGEVLTLYFEDNTYLRVQTVPTKEGIDILGMKTGTWTTTEQNTIEVLT